MEFLQHEKSNKIYAVIRNYYFQNSEVLEVYDFELKKVNKLRVPSSGLKKWLGFVSYNPGKIKRIYFLIKYYLW